MRIITRRRLREYAAARPDAASALRIWATITGQAAWRNLVETRRDFPHADEVRVKSGKPVTVFNVRGNKHRLIVAIHYNREAVYVLRFLTHAEYDKGAWKRTL
ncbi:MAG: type II toxin-antitoxin system HigB family toxin [Tepidisphaeraceae bacterium]